MSAIFDTSFHLKPLNENAYNLTINFKEQSGKSSKRKFTFKQQSTADEGVILDVFTKNGKCQNSLLSQLFNLFLVNFLIREKLKKLKILASKQRK